MNIHQFKKFLLLGVAVFTATNVSAQVYKCRYVDKAGHQTKVVYTDEPCSIGSKQTTANIQAKPIKVAQQNQLSAAQESSDALDNAVTQAVLNKNFELAKSLAVTKEHWRLIAVANQPAPAKPALEAVEPAQVVANNPCEDATKEFDYTSRVHWRDDDLIAAKKSIMYAACGVPEPAPSQPVYIGQSYGYPYPVIISNRWVPNGRPHHNPWRHPTSNDQFRPNAHDWRGNGHNNGQRAPEGLSVNIRSNRFGLQVGGYNQHSSRYNQTSTTMFNSSESR
jgi:hypothetical protein